MKIHDVPLEPAGLEGRKRGDAMQGNVYQIVSHRYGGQPHLYVVVLEFSGNRDCIVVPGAEQRDTQNSGTGALSWPRFRAPVLI
jgi:hypothetical protein